MKSNYRPEYRELLKQLQVARKKSGVTQQELSRLLGKPQSFVSKYENGDRCLDVIEFIEITEIIGADYETIIRRSYKFH